MFILLMMGLLGLAGLRLSVQADGPWIDPGTDANTSSIIVFDSIDASDSN